MSNCEPVSISRSATLNQTLDLVKEYSLKGINNEWIKSIYSEAILKTDPLKFIYEQVYKKLLYKSDSQGFQDIKAIHCILKSGYANCVDYSVIFGALLLKLQIPFYYKIISISEPNEFEHIYIVTKSGVVLDACLGQPTNNTATFENRTENGAFNKECPHKYSQLYEITRSDLAKHNKKSRLKLSRQMTHLRTLNGVNRTKLVRQSALNGVGDWLPGVISSVGGVLGNLFGSGSSQVTPQNYQVPPQPQSSDNSGLITTVGLAVGGLVVLKVLKII
jgi:hypothetical protein